MWSVEISLTQRFFIGLLVSIRKKPVFEKIHAKKEPRKACKADEELAPGKLFPVPFSKKGIIEVLFSHKLHLPAMGVLQYSHLPFFM